MLEISFTKFWAKLELLKIRPLMTLNNPYNSK